MLPRGICQLLPTQHKSLIAGQTHRICTNLPNCLEKIHNLMTTSVMFPTAVTHPYRSGSRWGMNLCSYLSHLHHFSADTGCVRSQALESVSCVRRTKRDKNEEKRLMHATRSLTRLGIFTLCTPEQLICLFLSWWNWRDFRNCICVQKSTSFDNGAPITHSIWSSFFAIFHKWTSVDFFLKSSAKYCSKSARSFRTQGIRSTTNIRKQCDVSEGVAECSFPWHRKESAVETSHKFLQIKLRKALLCDETHLTEGIVSLSW